MGIFIDLNESLSEESQLFISFKKVKDSVIFKVTDSEKEGVKGVKVFLDDLNLGLTNENGIVKIDKSVIPREGIVRAVIGLYSGSKRFKL
ncbi:MAG: hypothetical protein JW791_03420 [Nanoarchaeota archaeon]|nr:hypothetical protein [Nanoarchaeota archaeon]